MPLLVFVLGLKAQQGSSTTTIYASIRSYASSGKELPFWFRANQNGTFPVGNGTTQLLRAGISRVMSEGSANRWDVTYGTDLAGGFAGKSYFQPNQYWLGVRYQWLVLKAGAQADPIRFGGLSSTNGNMDASNNARPVPNLSLSTNGYISFPFNPGVFSWKALYSEGMLWDNSYIQNAHLHHKNFYFKMDLPQKWNFSLGVEHYVFWGGVSPELGKMPGWEEYFRYAFGMKGGKGASTIDRINVAGNQLGFYGLEVNKQWKYQQLTFYWNHPFEDRSGMELVNIPDGLWGVHWEKKQQSHFLTEVVYEWVYTLNQSKDPRISPIRGGDSYFNHGEYQSGYTHYAHMMGSPLFVPMLDANGVSKGFESTRMWMHHLGLKGWLRHDLFWKTMLTYSENFGEYQNPYPEPHGEFSYLGEINYQMPRFPLQLSGGLAGDTGNRFEERVGGFFGLKWFIK